MSVEGQPVEWGKVYERTEFSKKVVLEEKATVTIVPSGAPVEQDTFDDMYDELCEKLPTAPNKTNPVKKWTVNTGYGQYELLDRCLDAVPSEHTDQQIDLCAGKGSGDAWNGGIGWQNDHVHNFDHESGVFFFIFYQLDFQTSLFRVRKKSNVAQEVAFELGQGDLVVMKGKCFQKNYDHRAEVSRTSEDVLRRIHIILRKTRKLAGTKKKDKF